MDMCVLFFFFCHVSHRNLLEGENHSVLSRKKEFLRRNFSSTYFLLGINGDISECLFSSEAAVHRLFKWRTVSVIV